MILILTELGVETYLDYHRTQLILLISVIVYGSSGPQNRYTRCSIKIQVPLETFLLQNEIKLN